MDEMTLNLLAADLNAQGREIAAIYAKIHEREPGFETDEERRESLGYQLHNLYCAYEDLFQLVAEAFENRIDQGAGWHVELLARMRQTIAEVRPALIDEQDHRLLGELRSFRHVFRHAYASSLDPQKLRPVVAAAAALEERYPNWVPAFLAACRRALPPA
jgi:uncharacterized protein YutE (UPF0331/DUF86 family)